MKEKRKILLVKAMKNGGRISVTTANRLYSGNNGKDALISLEFQGYLNNEGFGNFSINTSKKFPEEVLEMYRDWKRSQEDGVDESGSYEVEAV